jgi:hypothetical protein
LAKYKKPFLYASQNHYRQVRKKHRFDDPKNGAIRHRQVQARPEELVRNKRDFGRRRRSRETGSAGRSDPGCGRSRQKSDHQVEEAGRRRRLSDLALRSRENGYGTYATYSKRHSTSY